MLQKIIQLKRFLYSEYLASVLFICLYFRQGVLTLDTALSFVSFGCRKNSFFPLETSTSKQIKSCCSSDNFVSFQNNVTCQSLHLYTRGARFCVKLMLSIVYTYFFYKQPQTNGQKNKQQKLITFALLSLFFMYISRIRIVL